MERSYGIHVAKLAELPDEVTTRANDLLKTFEQDGRVTGSEQLSLPLDDTEAFEAHPVIDRLKALDINQMTPLDAMMKLQELKNELEGE